MRPRPLLHKGREGKHLSKRVRSSLSASLKECTFTEKKKGDAGM